MSKFIFKFLNIENNQVKKDPEINDLVLYVNSITRQITDMAFIAFLKVMGYIKLSKILVKYTNHEGLKARLG